MEFFVISLLNGDQLRAAAVHAELRPDADLQHDGRAEFRARQLLHAGRVLRLHDHPAGRLLAGAVPGAAAGRRCSARCSRRYGLRRVHKFGHVPELLFTFGLSFIILEMVQLIWGTRSVPYRVPPLLDGPAVHAVRHPVPEASAAS